MFDWEDFASRSSAETFHGVQAHYALYVESLSRVDVRWVLNETPPLEPAT